jgi:hypothetical protein
VNTRIGGKNGKRRAANGKKKLSWRVTDDLQQENEVTSGGRKMG